MKDSSFQQTRMTARFYFVGAIRTTRFTARVFSLLVLVFVCGLGLGMAQSVHINEVESNGGTPDDWIELTNSGASTIDIAGWRLLDNDNTHAFYVFPAGSMIAPGGFLVVDIAPSFGLGGADSVRLYDPTATVPASTPYEVFSWAEHATTTYGRCPNGTGAFTTTVSSTKGATNDCPVRINEVESNGGTPDDWFELYNAGATAVDLSGWKMKDNDDTHPFFVFPAGSTIAPGGYLVFDTMTTSTPNGFPFGLGAVESVRIFDPSETLYETYTQTAHANTTYGRCPNGTGAFTTTASSTKGAANDCGGPPASPVRINEVESSGGVPVDWIELYNTSATATNIGNFVLKDNDDSHIFMIPSGTMLDPGAYLAFDVDVGGGFGLGDVDSARLFDNTGALVDSTSWSVHAATTFGRCPNGTGVFETTIAPTKGAGNACRIFASWPGGADVQTVDGLNVFGGNLSGLIYEGATSPKVLWAVRNGPESLFRLVFDGTIWTPDTFNSWGAGKLLLYPSGGAAKPDSEGVTFAGDGSSGGVYVSVERDNNNNGVSRNSILRFDPLMAGATLTATHEWHLTADLPSTGPNLGAEAIAWIPDSFLTASNFFDAGKNHTYDPNEYPGHGTGLFFLGLEANGNIYAYALDHGGSGTFTRIASIATGLAGVMDLQFDSLLNDFWAICDDTCQGRSVVLRIDGTGNFVVAGAFQRPGGMPNFNNEGFAITPGSECVSGLRPVFWADDTEDNGHAIRSGTLSCSPIVNFPDAIAPKAFPVVSPLTDAVWHLGDVTVNWNWADNPGGSGIGDEICTASTSSSGEGSLLLTATCKDVAGNSGNAAYTVKVDKTDPIVTASAKKADNTPYIFGTWSDQTVTVHFACSDEVSLIAGCSADAVISLDGETFVSGNGTDNAGRTGDSGPLLVRIDRTRPSLSIVSPAKPSYLNTAKLPINWIARDSDSGLASEAATLDGDRVRNGQVVDLFFESLGTHRVIVRATDDAGNTSRESVSFSVIATADSIRASIDRLVAMDAIKNARVANDLKAKLDGNSHQLKALLDELDELRGQKINHQAYALLKAAVQYLISHPSPVQDEDKHNKHEPSHEDKKEHDRDKKDGSR